MRICHVSDTHGPVRFNDLPQPSGFDVFVHSGDWLPDVPARGRAETIPYQMEFLRHEGAALAAWLNGKPFVFCLGNHDLLTESWVERELRSLGVNAFAPGPKGTAVAAGPEAVCFRGFRETPFICADFEGGYDDVELGVRTQSLADKWHTKDVLVAHCPPSGPLSSRPEWGNRHLARLLAEDAYAPALVLVGHVHERGGEEVTIGKSRVVNGARTVRLVDSCEWPKPGRAALG